jgi:hypothetical protein
MNKTRSHKSEEILLSEKSNFRAKKIDQGLSTSICECEKGSLPSKKDEGIGTVQSSNDSIKKQQGFLISGDKDAIFFLSNQLIMSFIGSDPVDEKELDKIMKKGMSLLVGINPQDQVETMLAVQMVATHNLSMALIREAHRSKFGIRTEMFSHLASKIARVFTSQVEALGKYRNKGNQKIIVEHVTVNEGGQAIVGSEINQGGGIKK